jgi:predicted 3-demethylubiquinone-9 3-methyltransferase (glyoxalase superfamily)
VVDMHGHLDEELDRRSRERQGDNMPKVTPFLWFDTQAEEAVRLYTSIFPNSRVTATTRYGEAGPGPKGSVMTMAFELDGQPFTAINGGPQYKFSPAVSFVVHCKTQEEVDAYWDRLSAGGKPNQCGWLDDKFGLTWQIVPTALPEMLKDKDPKKTQAVMREMFTMTKLDIARLKNAYDGA